MTSSLNQGRIIRNLNKYLRWNHFPLKLNEGGVCHGLARVYAKYILEGREDEFKRMLKFISGELTASSLKEKDEVNSFIASVLLSFSPERFDKTYIPQHKFVKK